MQSLYNLWRFQTVYIFVPLKPEHVFVNLLRSPGIDTQPGALVRQPARQAMQAGGINSLDPIPGLMKVYKYELSPQVDSSAFMRLSTGPASSAVLFNRVYSNFM